MNENSVNDDVIIVEHSLVEQHSQIDIQQHENVTQNRTNIIRQAKKMPMNLTPLYISSFSF